MKKVIAILAVVVMLGGCAGFGKWSTESQAKLDTFAVWAGEWIGGALKLASPIILAASAIAGDSTEVKLASQALVSAQSALASYKAIVAVGSTSDIASQEKAVLDAIKQVNSTIGAIRGAVAIADPT